MRSFKNGFFYSLGRYCLLLLIIIILSFLVKIINFDDFLFIENVHAVTLDNYIKINNTSLGTGVKFYTPGNTNLTLTIDYNSTYVDDTKPSYGYIALCSALGSLGEKRPNTASSSTLKNINIVNSSTGCTIPTTDAYNNTARVLYFTFEIPQSEYTCGVAGHCFFFAESLAFYQPGSNEFSLVSYGFDDKPFDFNGSVNPLVDQNATIINQNDTIISQNNNILTATVNGANAIRDAVTSNTDRQIANINDDNENEIKSQGDDFVDMFGDVDYSLADVIIMPLQYIESMTDSTCTPLTFQLPFTHNQVTIPCMSSIYNQFPSFYSLWQTITTGLIGYWVSINLFAMFKRFKDPMNDRVEVMDL